MADALHIDSPKAAALAQKLAERTGETATDAVVHALGERLEHLHGTGDGAEDAKVKQLLEIAEGDTGLRAQKKTSRELVEELYDEDGLPR
jgi:hypothetical protein